MTETWTILKMLQWITEYFSERGIDSPRLDGELLLSFALGLTRVKLYTQFDRPLNAEELEAIKKLVKRRALREPLAYLLGTKEFYSLEFAVSPAVLVPRPETEILVEEGIKLFRSQNPPTPPFSKEGEGEFHILDIGTGSGCIAIALAKNIPEAEVWAADISPTALALAELNAKKNGVEARFHAVRWNFLKDPWEPSRDPFDLILSNPPYIPTATLENLAPELKFEPKEALDGGDEGLDAYRALIPWARDHLQGEGEFLLEIGEGQADPLEKLANEAGFARVERINDLAGHPRVLKMKRG